MTFSRGPAPKVVRAGHAACGNASCVNSYRDDLEPAQRERTQTLLLEAIRCLLRTTGANQALWVWVGSPLKALNSYMNQALHRGSAEVNVQRAMLLIVMSPHYVQTTIVH